MISNQSNIINKLFVQKLSVHYVLCSITVHLNNVKMLRVLYCLLFLGDFGLNINENNACIKLG